MSSASTSRQVRRKENGQSSSDVPANTQKEEIATAGDKSRRLRAKVKSSASQYREPEFGNSLGHTVESQIIPSLMQLLQTRADQPSARQRQFDDVAATAQSRGLELETNPVGATSEPSYYSTSEYPDNTNTEALGEMVKHDPKAFDAYLDNNRPAASVPDPDQFAALVLDDDENLALRFVYTLRSQGIKDEQIISELLAPTSQALGRRWEEDQSDFVDVTIGVCRLHRILRWLHPQHDRNIQRTAHGGRIALAPVPGEQHSFGLLLAGDLLYRNGWYTDIDIEADSWRLPATVNHNWYELIGLSLSCETRIDVAKETISELRRASCNPNVVILIGGRLLTEQPEVAKLVGADVTASDAPALVTLAEKYAPSTTMSLT